jgi:hypothetical protein
VPLLPEGVFTVSKEPILYYSYAITTNSCINVLPPTAPSICGQNVYTYTLYECSEELSETPPIVICPQTFETHGADVCQVQSSGLKLGFCSSISSQSPLINKRYMCTITGGPGSPKENAYIEWHWYAKYADADIPGVPVTVTGKFIFVASGDYIKSQHALTSYGGNGIGMFNPSNHNA